MPMVLTITDDLYQNMKSGCRDDYDWESIADPGRYNGGPDPIWTGYAAFSPYKAQDGTWSMTNPFIDWTFVVNGQIYRRFNYRHDWMDRWVCNPTDVHTGSSTLEVAAYGFILRPLKDMPLIGDPTGTYFRLDTSYTVDTGGIPLNVDFHATVTESGCHGLAAPIDISNPALKVIELALQAEDTTPDGEATVQARVTCEGVPVVNAPVVVALKAVGRTGGHRHDDGVRPRGYIDGVEQTAASKFIAITDSDGAATVTINPGRDLTNKSRGIAGWYSVDARVEWEGLTSPSTRSYIDAYLDLVPLPDSPNEYLLEWTLYGADRHAEPFSGTPATVERIPQLAHAWNDVQFAHNIDLFERGKDAWPSNRLQIYAISLPKGGLFDERASRPWRTPFEQHRTGVDVNVYPAISPVPPEAQLLWYERAFRRLGNEYGAWFTDSGQPFHLRITKAPANALENSMPALNTSPSADADVAASAALVDPAGRFVAGAGQNVTYSVGVENLAAGTEASQVALSAALPAGLNFISADPPQSRMQDPRTPVWDIGSLPDEGAPRTFDVNAQVDPSIAAGAVLTVTATATTSSPDADPANNPFSAWGLTAQQPGPDLVIGSDFDATALTSGEPVTFTLGLSNEGNAPAPNSWFELTAPAGITITKTSPTASTIPGGVRWDAGDLAPGDERTATVDLEIDPSLLDQAALSADAEPEYPLSFTMTAGSDSADIDPASNQMQVDKRVESPGPDLLVALRAGGTPGPGVFEVGQEVTYTLRYANAGNRQADEATAALRLWPGLTLMQSQPAPTTNQLDTTSGVRTLTWSLGELSIGVEGAIETRLRVDDVPDVGSIIRADISSNSIDLNPADNAVMETRYEASNAGKYKIYLPVVLRG